MTMSILHRTRNISVLMPRYVERFRCTGSSCEDTCCHGWPIHFDKKTYKAYRAHGQANATMRPLSALIQRMDDPPEPGMYAVLPMSPVTGGCPAHQNGMCAIQSSAGESYLSNTCHNFPRNTLRMNGQFEQALTLSCPEAARLALLAEDAFDFIEAPVSVRESSVRAIRTRDGFSAEVMGEARIFSINLVRTRELPLWQRLSLLGTFCQALEACLDSGQDTVQDLIGDFVRAIESGELTRDLDAVQPSHEAQAMVFATLWASRGFSAASPFQANQMAGIAAGLGGDTSGQVSGADLAAAYRRGLARLDQALEAAPWLLEHYLLNEMFIHQFPIAWLGPYDAYLQLVARFGLLRLLLAAQCNTDDELPSAAALAATVQLQSRRFQHDPQFAAEITRSLRSSGWADPVKVDTLLRT